MAFNQTGVKVPDIPIIGQGPQPISKLQAVTEALFLLTHVKARLMAGEGIHQRKLKLTLDRAHQLLEKSGINPRNFEASVNDLLRDWSQGTGQASPLAIPNTTIVLPPN